MADLRAYHDCQEIICLLRTIFHSASFFSSNSAALQVFPGTGKKQKRGSISLMGVED